MTKFRAHHSQFFLPAVEPINGDAGRFHIQTEDDFIGDNKIAHYPWKQQDTPAYTLTTKDPDLPYTSSPIWIGGNNQYVRNPRQLTHGHQAQSKAATWVIVHFHSLGNNVNIILILQVKQIVESNSAMHLV